MCLDAEKAKAFLGASYTGKTSALIAEISAWLGAGGKPSDALVLCVSPAAAREFETRLRSMCPDACDIRIATPCERFLEILDTPDARKATGRIPRLLLPYEYSFFLEDLKTSAIRPRRLREMLKFLYKGFSDLADDDPDWLVTNEERELVALMRSSLRFMGAVLKEETPGLVVKYLREKTPEAAPVRTRAVFVDDFHLLSRASQHAACMLATEFICIAADDEMTFEADEVYPCADGVREFLESRPAAQVVRLNERHSCGAAARWASRLRRIATKDEPFDWENAVLWSKTAQRMPIESGDDFEVLCGDTPDDEFARIADKVERLLAQGCCERDIVIAAESPVWRQGVASGLHNRGIRAAGLSETGFLKCDVRSIERSVSARMVALLNLLADPCDGVAWRCWCGFGDYLANSNGMRRLRESRCVEDANLADLLLRDDLQSDDLGSLDAVSSVQRIMRARDDAYAAIEHVRGLEGMALLEAIAEIVAGQNVPKAVRKIARLALAWDSEGANDAASMARRLRFRAVFPSFVDADAVKVMSYTDMAGFAPQHLVLAGFLNGAFPAHEVFDETVLSVDRMQRRRVHDAALIASVVPKSSGSLTVALCCKADLEAAQRCGLVVSRIALEAGRRVASLEPSVFLKPMEGEPCRA